MVHGRTLVLVFGISGSLLLVVCLEPTKVIVELREFGLSFADLFDQACVVTLVLNVAETNVSSMPVKQFLRGLVED